MFIYHMDFRDEKKEALINIAMVFGIIVFLLAVNVNHVQKLILKKAERLLDESVRTGIVEYYFSVDGIEIISQLVISKNY